MIIYYVFSSAGVIETSVQTKVINQIIALNGEGVICKGLFFTTDDFSQLPKSEFFDFIAIPKVKKKYFRSLIKKKIVQHSIYKFFKNKNLDFIYYRYDNAGYFLAKLATEHKNKIFFEHVTAETKEIKLYRKENPLRPNFSSFLGNIEYLWFPLLREKLWGKIIRSNAIFGICNSVDIEKHEKQIARGQYNTIVLGDAVKTSNYDLRHHIPELKSEFRIFFLKGASTSADFNGLDRVFKGIKNYLGAYHIKMFLYGRNLTYEQELICKYGLTQQVLVGEYQKKEQLDILLKEMHLGISAMGLHRKGILSTTTIKAREYFARGIPFIFGHNDPDISESKEAMKYCLEFKPNDDPIDFEMTINWYKDLNKNNLYPLKMRKFAEKNLDYEVKMEQLRSYVKNSTQN